MNSKSNTDRGESLRGEGHMASAETEVREFAREFPTPNVQRAIALCEAGQIEWTAVHKLFRKALAKGLEEVAA